MLRYPALFAYGLFGMPLAMAALPLYVHLPKFYGDHLGVPLAALGGVLLLLRLADGVLDPLLGAWSDRARSRKRLIALAVPVLAVGMVALFAPQVSGDSATAGLARRRARRRLSRVQPRDDQPQRVGRGIVAAIRSSARASPRRAKAWRWSASCWPASRRR